jgi:multidrug resistance efflux pump
MSLEYTAQQATESCRAEFARGMRSLLLRADMAEAVVAALRADGATITVSAPHDGHVGLRAVCPGDAASAAADLAELEAEIAARRPRG